MKAEAMSLTFLGNEGLVRIPFFQRGYVWNIENWEDIISDLLDFKKSHFLGSLILKQLEKQTGKPKEVLVIDGQQRLTTLSILLRALYNSFDEETQNNCDSSIRNYLFFKKNQTDKNFFVKIEHSKIDKKYYQKVINNEIPQDEYDAIVVENPATKTTSKSNKVLQCFKYFSDKLKETSVENRLELFNRLLDQENKILVVIDLSEKEDEQAIFDTINSAGVRLSSADIIKNALFQKALDLFDSIEEVEALYKDHWENVFLMDEDAINFWDTPRATGRLMRDNIEILLHSISVIKGFFDPDKHTLSDLSSLYKSFILKISKVDLEAFIEEISKYAKLFREKILVFNSSSLFSYQDSSRLFHILSVCEISTFHPYILSLFYKYDKNESKLNEELHKIESLIIRRMITKSETKSYNKMCKEFIKDNSNIDIKISEHTKDEILNGLSSISNKNATLLLFWVELYRRANDSKQSVKELKYNYSLEHIMPQKWEEYWGDVDILDSNSNIIMDKEAAKRERYSKIYSIGNLTLLNSSLNTSLRNYEFSRKIEGEGRKRGIRHYADLGITRFDILDNYDNGDKVWNEQKINQRTTNLANDILAMW
ncbi:DUF262 domain-containing protein [Emticicia sp. SJ17W-69]|uniref:DUF262 domain-containing protein n=1 Tax=Emticicia sp. SJ17W-69 TaxID=3421657 RepID=UPI003EB87221